jgi:hypothetical protein
MHSIHVEVFDIAAGLSSNFVAVPPTSGLFGKIKWGAFSK